MAPSQSLFLPSPHHTMTRDDYLSLGLLILSQNQEFESTHSQQTKLHFKCCICGKEFSSYQALGGHKSSHRRPKNPDEIKAFNTKPNLINLLDSNQGTHRCNVCFRSFSTGQALGGHKRCHYWDGSNGSVVSGSSATSTLSSIRDFDLNLPPKSGWGEEDEVLSPLPAKKQRLI